MASWNHKAFSHCRQGSYFFQINTPLDRNINEFEVVAFKNGVVVNKTTFWDSSETHKEGVDMVYDHLTYIPDYGSKSQDYEPDDMYTFEDYFGAAA